MSNALAIGSVTATLRGVLEQALTGINVNGAHVTSLRPDAKALPNPGVNVFLYRVAPNPAFRHADLPARTADGTLLRRPQAALDLHYLLTFHGDDNLEEPQRLMGAVVRRLHTLPVLQPAEIRAITSAQAQLAGTDLADQAELVRVLPDTGSLDDLSRLWAMFPETAYSLSALYVASVVLIEAELEQPAPGIPVQQFTLSVVPMALPVIESVVPQTVDGGSPPSSVSLRGRNLIGAAQQSSVLIDGRRSASIGGASTPTAVTFAVPVDLQAGLHSVQLVRADPLGPPHIGSASNPAHFALRPRLISINLAGNVARVAVTPFPTAVQRIVLLLNELGAGPVSRSFQFAVVRRTTDTDPVTFNAAQLARGTSYLARVQVDGVESALSVDGAGEITGPILHAP
jgi:hypothetical protein